RGNLHAPLRHARARLAPVRQLVPRDHRQAQPQSDPADRLRARRPARRRLCGDGAVDRALLRRAPRAARAGLRHAAGERRLLAVAVTRTGVIYNPRSRRNRAAAIPARAPGGLWVEAPRNREALDEALAHFAQAGVELLVVDGGDGTVREGVTRAPTHFHTSLPTLAVLPSGKTNALALDLGAPRTWTLNDALKS